MNNSISHGPCPPKTEPTTVGTQPGWQNTQTNSACLYPFLRSIGPAAAEIICNYPSIFLKNVAQQGGAMPKLSLRNALACYRGFSISAAGVIPSKSGMLASYTETKKILDQTTIENNSLKHVISGAVGGAVAALIGSTFELLTIQKQRSATLSLADLAKKVSAQPVPHGIGRGLSLAVARDSLYSAMILGASPGVKNQLPEKIRNELIGTLLAATATGITAALTTQPIDTVKTLVQASNLDSPPPKLSSLVSNMNLADYYRGSAFRLYRITQGAVIILGMQELIDRAFSQVAQTTENQR